MDIEKQEICDEKNNKINKNVCFRLFGKICYFLYEILILYVIYIILSIIVLLSPCFFTIAIVQKKLKFLQNPMKLILFLILSLLIVPFSYVLIAIVLPIYFVTVVFIQIFSFCCSKNRKTSLISHEMDKSLNLIYENIPNNQKEESGLIKSGNEKEESNALNSK